MLSRRYSWGPLPLVSYDARYIFWNFLCTIIVCVWTWIDVCVCVIAYVQGRARAQGRPWPPDCQHCLVPLYIGTDTSSQGIGEAYPDYLHGELECFIRANRLWHILHPPGRKKSYLQVETFSFPLPWTNWKRLFKYELKNNPPKGRE